MSENLETCIEPYLPAFEQTYAAENYTARTIITYRCRARKFGALLDQAGIAPSSVTLDCVEPLTREVPRARKNTIRLDTIARRLVQHLIDIGVAQPVPLTEAEAARAALLADFENYLVKQRGLSPRSVPHTIGFARRFLDYRFGAAIIDLGSLRPADAIGFMERVLTSARRDKTVATHVRIFLQYLFGCGATATNLALSVPKAANFAVKTMIGWYRTGKDPAREMIRLTTYLGHSDPSNTYWYLEAVPELLDLAMTRATADGREAVQ